MANPSKEPSMEDILSSIRDIISEDEVPAAPPAAASAARGNQGQQAAKARDPMVLQRPVEATPPLSAPRALDARSAGGDLRAGGDRGVRGGYDYRIGGTRLMAEETEIAGINSFAELDEAIRLGRVGDTLADVVITILRPMLKDWLDENLPDMVEDMIQKEIRRLAEGGRKKRIVEDMGDLPD